MEDNKDGALLYICNGLNAAEKVPGFGAYPPMAKFSMNEVMTLNIYTPDVRMLVLNYFRATHSRDAMS